MKRERALRYCREIHDQLVLAGGMLHTPNYSHEHVLFKKVWLFGSTAKGSLSPRDVDILYHIELIGPNFRRNTELVMDTRVSKQRFWGGDYPMQTSEAAYKWLRRRRPMVSLHSTEYERAIFPDKIQIYPDYLLPKEPT